MTILVTGALGFVGVNLVRHLAETGAEVVALDLAAPGAAERVFLAPARARIAFAQADIRDRDAVAAALRRAAPRVVVHGAAITPDPALEAARSDEVLAVNVGGTADLVAAAGATCGVARVVVLSSSGVYGPGGGEGSLTEDAALAGRNLYARSKIEAERAAARAAGAAGLDCVIARVPAVYGPMERARPTRPRISAIGRLVDAASSRARLRVAGPAIVRDWSWAGDVAAAIAALAAAPALRHRVYNVGCGVGARFDAAVAAAEAAGMRADWVAPDEAELAMRPEDSRTPLDIGRLAADTGFAPRVGLAEGIARAVAARRAESVPA